MALSGSSEEDLCCLFHLTLGVATTSCLSVTLLGPGPGSSWDCKSFHHVWFQPAAHVCDWPV